ncbi:putative E3 ubiquitin-protein ligase RING1a isoform B [Balamuthia mandrillaris]
MLFLMLLASVLEEEVSTTDPALLLAEAASTATATVATTAAAAAGGPYLGLLGTLVVLLFGAISGVALLIGLFLFLTVVPKEVSPEEKEAEEKFLKGLKELRCSVFLPEDEEEEGDEDNEEEGDEEEGEEMEEDHGEENEEGATKAKKKKKKKKSKKSKGEFVEPVNYYLLTRWQLSKRARLYDQQLVSLARRSQRALLLRSAQKSKIPLQQQLLLQQQRLALPFFLRALPLMNYSLMPSSTFASFAREGGALGGSNGGGGGGGSGGGGGAGEMFGSGSYGSYGGGGGFEDGELMDQQQMMMMTMMDHHRHHQQSNYILHLTVERASNLVASNRSGKSDPYLKISLGSQQVKTKVVFKDLNPEWNASFVLYVNDPEKDRLILRVLDYERVGSSKPLGSAVVELNGLVKGEEQEHTVALSGLAQTDKTEVPATGEITLALLLLDKRHSPQALMEAKASKQFKQMQRQLRKEKKKEERRSSMAPSSLSSSSLPPSSTNAALGSNSSHAYGSVSRKERHSSSNLAPAPESYRKGSVSAKNLPQSTSSRRKSGGSLSSSSSTSSSTRNRSSKQLGGSNSNMPGSKQQLSQQQEQMSSAFLAELRAMMNTARQGSPVKQGWLEIRALRIWKRRWFRLYANGLLVYYRAKPKRKEKIYGILMLDKTCKTKPSSKKRNAFFIYQSERKPLFSPCNAQGKKLKSALAHGKSQSCVLRCSDVNDLHNWLEALAFVLGTSSGDYTFSSTASLSTSATATEEDDSTDEEVAGDDGASDSGSSSDEDGEEFGLIGDGAEEDELDTELSSVTSSLSSSAASSSPGSLLDDDIFVMEGIKEGELGLETKDGVRRYWFSILGNGGLACYVRNPGSTKKKQELRLGTITLDDCELTVLAQAGKSSGTGRKRAFPFQITHREKKDLFRIRSELEGSGSRYEAYIPELPPQSSHCCVLMADSEESLQHWVDCISEEIALCDHRQEFYKIPKEVPVIQVPFINIVARRIFEDVRTSEDFKREVLKKVGKKLASINRPSFLAPIVAQSLSFGGPLQDVVKGVRVVPGDAPNELFGEVDVDFRAGFEIRLTTELRFSISKTQVASVPLLIHANVLSLSGKVHIYAPAQLQCPFSVFFSQVPELKLQVNVMVGAQQIQVTSLPRIQEFIGCALQKLLRSRLVYPGRVQLFVPFPGRKLDITIINAVASKPRKNRRRELPIIGFEPEDDLHMKDCTARFFDSVLNKGVLQVVDELFASECSLKGGSMVDSVLTGRNAVKTFVDEIHDAFPDIMFYVEDISCSPGSRVVCRWRARGTNEGSFWGYLPTSKELRLRGVFIITFDDEVLISSLQCYWSLASLLNNSLRGK